MNLEQALADYGLLHRSIDRPGVDTDVAHQQVDYAQVFASVSAMAVAANLPATSTWIDVHYALVLQVQRATALGLAWLDHLARHGIRLNTSQ